MMTWNVNHSSDFSNFFDLESKNLTKKQKTFSKISHSNNQPALSLSSIFTNLNDR